MAITNPSPIESPGRPPAGVGAELRRAREDLGRSLDEIAEATLIPKRYLEALEHDASTEEYPAPAFARHFLREYARHLGLGEDALLERLGIPPPGSELPQAGPIEERAPPAWRRPLGVALLVSALIGVTVFAADALRGGAAPARPVPLASNAATPPGLVATPTPTPAPASPRAIVLVVSTTGSCWVQATADGTEVLANVLPAGSTVKIHAKRTLQVVVGAPGVARLTANGKPVPLSGTSGVANLTFTLSGGRLQVS